MRYPFHAATVLSLLLYTLLLSFNSFARENVAIGIYDFAPFAFHDSKHQPSGMSYDLKDALNALQEDYEFTFYHTSPTARYKAFERGHFDMLMFESKQWGWQQLPILASKSYLTGGEIYIARQSSGRDQRFFEVLDNKSIIGIKGYHYGFAQFNSNKQYLIKHFNMLFTHSNESSIRMLLGGRGDIAVVTESYLKLYLQDHPDLKSRLLASKKKDQTYHHTILIREGHPITPEKINHWLQQLDDRGTLDTIWQKWGLK